MSSPACYFVEPLDIYYSLQVISRKSWESLHGKACDSNMSGKMPTSFTQAGVNIFRDPAVPEEKDGFSGRDGFVGWMGLGGSVFQWHPDRQVSFAYVPTLVDWTDLNNGKALKLQRAVMQCVSRRK